MVRGVCARKIRDRWKVGGEVEGTGLEGGASARRRDRRARLRYDEESDWTDDEGDR